MNGSDVQIERGSYFQIHNAIAEQLAKTELTGREARILWALLRLTYGYRKKEDAIALSQFCELTGMAKPHVFATLKKLTKRQIIKRTGGGVGRGNIAVYGFNKYWEEWDTEEKVPDVDNLSEPEKVPLKVSTGVPISETVKGTRKRFEKVPQTPIKGTPDHEHTKDSITKDNIPKTKGAAAPAPEVDPVFASFVKAYERCWGLTLTATDGDRVHEWCVKIPLQVWEYALQQTKDGAGAGRWNYMLKVLARVQTEGIEDTRNPTRNNNYTNNRQNGGRHLDDVFATVRNNLIATGRI